MSGWGTALRIARRDAWQHRGRSLLVMALVALPVLAAVAGDVLIRSGERTPAEQADSQLADADAWIIAPEGVKAVTQSWALNSLTPISISEAGPDSSNSGPPDLGSLPPRPASGVLPLLPAGSRITAWQHADDIPVSASAHQYVAASADLLDITSPAAGDRYRVLAGAAPTAMGQLAVTGHLAARLGVQVGDELKAGAPQQTYTVVGIVRPAATGGFQIPLDQFDAIVGLPGAVRWSATVWSGYDTRYLVTSPHPLGLSVVDDLNAHGIGMYSRTVAVDPAAGATLAPASVSPLLIGGLVIGIVMGLMQVVFLAGPAFAIGARRMRRQFGQLVATGARGTHLRMVVLSSGLVLGITGSLLGLILGVGVGAALRAAFRSWLGYRSSGLHLVPVELLGIAALGLVTAVLAALAPAISAGRASPLSLLGRQPGGSRPARWWSVAGVVLAAAGIVVTVWMATRPVPDQAFGATVRGRGLGLAGGAVLVEVGLLLAVPLAVRGASRLGRSLPTAGRLALRDADRHRGRTAPAIAAVTVCATIAMILAILLTSNGATMRSRYIAGIPVGDVQLSYATPGMQQPDEATAVGLSSPAVATTVRDQWPQAMIAPYSVTSGLSIMQGARGLMVPLENLCPFLDSADAMGVGQISDTIYPPTYAPRTPTASEKATAAVDWRCYGRSYSTLTAQQAHRSRTAGFAYTIRNTGMPIVVVGGPQLRRQLTRIADPAADAALKSGGAVAMDRTFLAADGTISSAVLATATDPAGGSRPASSGADSHGDSVSGPLRITEKKSVPAVLGRWSPTPLGVILSPQAAQTLGWTPQPGGMIINPGQPVTRAQTDNLALALNAASGHQVDVTQETGSLPGAGGSARPPLTALLIIVALLAAATIIVVTALGLADSRPDLATLAAVGAPPRLRRLVTGWSAGLVTVFGCLLGGIVGLVPAWGLLRLVQAIQGQDADPILVPWAVLVPLLVAVPSVAFAIGTLLPRSKLPMISRIE